MKRLAMGETTVVGKQSAINALAFGVSWDAPGVDIDVCGLGLTAGVVPYDDWFVFFNNRRSPNQEMVLLQPPSRVPGIDDSGQLLVALPDLEQRIDKVLVAAAALSSDDLSGVRNLTVRVLDLASADVLAAFECPGIYSDGCMVLMECYRHKGNWKVRAQGTPWRSLADLVTHHGVNLAH